MRATAKLLLLLIVAALAFAACGGPKHDDRELAAACARQNEEIAAEDEGDTPIAKSTEERNEAEHLNECAGQEKLVAASKTEMESATDENAPTTEGETGAEAPAPAPAKLDPAARELFVSSCGSCHALADAESTGAVGPGLDDTKFDAGMIENQILNGAGAMPAGLLEGDDATAVAEYVAAAAAAE